MSLRSHLLKMKAEVTETTLLEKFMMLPPVEKVLDFYYTIRSHIERAKRALAYAKLGYNNWDFDALTIEHYLAFKLKRVQNALINGHADLTVDMGPKYMKALKLAIKLADKLSQGDCGYMRFMDLHNAKWGEGEMVFTTVPGSEDRPGGPYSTMDMVREKANTPELKEQERKEFLEAAYADDREQEKHRKLLYLIINKYICYWWD